MKATDKQVLTLKAGLQTNMITEEQYEKATADKYVAIKTISWLFKEADRIDSECRRKQHGGLAQVIQLTDMNIYDNLDNKIMMNQMF